MRVLPLVLAAALATACSAVTLRENDATGLCDTVRSYSGYVDIDEATDKHYFYWGFESRNDPANDPVILWMTGGPGCSSELAVLYENGPCHVNSDGSDTYKNPYAWNTKANLVYIDQPAGTGFSYGDIDGYDHNETQVGNDMYKFLQGFFDLHPELLDNDFYIIGESYGGHFVPATSNRVYIGNQKKEGKHINLKGVAVGNGLTDPLIQYEYYSQMAYNYSIEKIGHPVISEQAYAGMVASWPKCQSMIYNCQFDDSVCSDAETFCNNAMMGPYDQTGLNPYDIRSKCKYQPLCYDFNPITKWLNNQTVTETLGVKKGITWSTCNFVVNGGFGSDWMRDYQQDLPALLESGIPVVIYAGDVDFVCNWLGNKAWTLNLSWTGQAAYNQAQDKPWMVNGEQAGESRSASGLTFIRVYNAGHMVPADQPAAALSMVETLTSGGSFP